MCIKCQQVLDFIQEYGGVDGGHHKQWLLDQIVRKLSPNYAAWVDDFEWGEDGYGTYEWSSGIAP